MAIAKVFIDVDMRLGIPGLTELCKSKRLGIMKSDAMVLFLNKKRNLCKIFWNKEFMLTFKKEAGYISIEELKNIPYYFRGNMFKSVTLEGEATGFLHQQHLKPEARMA